MLLAGLAERPSGGGQFGWPQRWGPARRAPRRPGSIVFAVWAPRPPRIRREPVGLSRSSGNRSAISFSSEPPEFRAVIGMTSALPGLDHLPSTLVTLTDETPGRASRDSPPAFWSGLPGSTSLGTSGPVTSRRSHPPGRLPHKPNGTGPAPVRRRGIMWGHGRPGRIDFPESPPRRHPGSGAAEDRDPATALVCLAFWVPDICSRKFRDDAGRGRGSGG